MTDTLEKQLSWFKKNEHEALDYYANEAFTFINKLEANGYVIIEKDQRERLDNLADDRAKVCNRLAQYIKTGFEPSDMGPCLDDLIDLLKLVNE